MRAETVDLEGKLRFEQVLRGVSKRLSLKNNLLCLFGMVKD